MNAALHASFDAFRGWSNRAYDEAFFTWASRVPQNGAFVGAGSRISIDEVDTARNNGRGAISLPSSAGTCRWASCSGGPAALPPDAGRPATGATKPSTARAARPRKIPSSAAITWLRDFGQQTGFSRRRFPGKDLHPPRQMVESLYEYQRAAFCCSAANQRIRLGILTRKRLSLFGADWVRS